MSQRPYLVLLIFLLIALAILAPLVPQFGSGLIYPAHAQYSDLTITHWPAFAYTRDQLQATGQLPMWRTSILSGTPFAANPLAGLFYPPHWLAFIPFVPLSLAFNLLMLSHLALAAATMYYLDAALVDRAGRGVDRRVCVCGLAQDHRAHGRGACHAGGGVGVGAVGDRGPHSKPHRRAPGKPNALLSGIALAMCLLADARMAVYALVLAGLYVLITRAQRNTRTWLALIGTLIVIGVVALALSAAAWLPALTLTDGTARARLSPQEAGTLSLDAAYLLGTLIADRSGAAERTTYVGLVVLVLAAVGVKLMWHPRRRLMIWFWS